MTDGSRKGGFNATRVSLPGAPRAGEAARGQCRRQFLSGLAASAAAVGCSGFPSGGTSDGAEVAPLPLYQGPPLGKQSSDQVMLGDTGIRVSRLAMGSGTHGFGGSSDQTRLGLEGF